MLELWNAFKNGIVNTFNWEVKQILFDVPWNQNYFYGLIVISLFVMLLEVLFPWRKEQKFFRKDFWLDTSYMFLNFFVFYIFLNGFFEMFNLGFSKLGIEWREWSLIPVENQSKWWVILSYFILNDFVACIDLISFGGFIKCTTVLKRWALLLIYVIIGRRMFFINR